MQNSDENHVEDILAEAGLIDTETLRRAKRIQEITGEKIDRILINDSVIDLKRSMEKTAELMGVGFVDLENIAVNREAVSRLNEDVVKRYSIFPFDFKNNFLLLAMQNPDDLFVIDEIKLYAQMEIKPYLAERRMIEKAIEYFYGIDMTSEENSKEKVSEEENQNTGKRECNEDGQLDRKPSGEMEIGKMVDIIVGKFSMNPSNVNVKDIHIDPASKKICLTLMLDY